MGLLFLGRDVAHSVHLNTRSFSKHEALNIFYNRIIGAADDFAEAYQGRYGLIGLIGKNHSRILPIRSISLFLFSTYYLYISLGGNK
jgi:hypothetical protein